MQDINLKATNRTNKQRLMDMDNRLVVTRGEGERERREIDEVNGVEYVVIERNFGEDVKKKECLYTAGGSIDLYRHYG